MNDICACIKLFTCTLGWCGRCDRGLHLVCVSRCSKWCTSSFTHQLYSECWFLFKIILTTWRQWSPYPVSTGCLAVSHHCPAWSTLVTDLSSVGIRNRLGLSERGLGVLNHRGRTASLIFCKITCFKISKICPLVDWNANKGNKLIWTCILKNTFKHWYYCRLICSGLIFFYILCDVKHCQF